MPSYETKPDAKTILTKHGHLKQLWSRAHSKWQDIDTYYQRTFRLWDEGVDRPSFRPARSTAIVDHAVDNQLAFDPMVHREPAGRGRAHEARADNIEPWVKAVLEETSLLEPQLTWKQIGKYLIMYGYTVVDGPVLSMEHRPPKVSRKKGEDDEDWKKREALYNNEKLTWMPFRIRATHPARVLMNPMEKQPQEAIKTVAHYAIDLHEMTKKRVGKRGQAELYELGDNWYELVPTVEYWSRFWHALIANEQLLFVEKNTWGFVPFSHAFSGWGSEPTDSRSFNPEHLAVGILDHIRESLLIHAQALSGRHNSLMEATFNTMMTSGDAMELAQQKARGNIIEGFQKGEAWWMDIPQLPQWMFQAVSEVEADIEFGTFSAAQAGMRQQGVSTVGQQAILSTAAAKKFVAPSQQLDHLATVAASNLLRLVDVLDESVTVRGHTITPSDIGHDYRVSVKFALIDPVLQLQRRQLGVSEVGMGLKSKETFWSADAQLEDATGEKKRMLIEKMEAHPAIQEILIRQAAEEFGLREMLERIEEEQVAQQAAPKGMVPAERAAPILGPDGRPLGQMMGSQTDVNKPLTPEVVNPMRLPLTATGAL